MEWNGGFWRYWGEGHGPQAGRAVAPSQRGTRLEALVSGPGARPFPMEEHRAHELFRTEAWWHRGTSLAEMARARVSLRRAAATSRRRAR